MLPFFKKQRPCLVGMEACATSHHWGRELRTLGHQVRLMPRQASKKLIHTLLESDWITSADHTALEHCGIDTHVGLIVLGRRPKDTHILGEISLGQCRHDATRAWAIDT